jgi:hypothetical protein
MEPSLAISYIGLALAHSQFVSSVFYGGACLFFFVTLDYRMNLYIRGSNYNIFSVKTFLAEMIMVTSKLCVVTKLVATSLYRVYLLKINTLSFQYIVQTNLSKTKLVFSVLA